MTKEKWQETINNIQDKFVILEKGEEHIDDEGGVDIAFIIFNGPLGKMRLEYIEKPVVLDRKTTYSRRIGSETVVDYIYSPVEKTQKMTVYKWDDVQEDWQEMDAGTIFGN
jgi:hypothetical protein